MNKTHLQTALLVLIACVAFFWNLGEARLWDRDEPRNAGCAAEMLSRGDWVVPTFNYELRQQKPALLYWLMMASYSVFGFNEFAARFPSAFLGIGTVLATYGVGRRLFSHRVGFIAGCALSTCLIFCLDVRAATPNSTLIFFSTLALMFYVLGTFPRNEEVEGEPIHDEPIHDDSGAAQCETATRLFPSHFLWIALLYVSLGLGALAKGPVGFVIPMAIIGLHILVQTVPARSGSSNKSKRLLEVGWDLIRAFHPLRFWQALHTMRLGWAILIVLAVALPWYLAVHFQTEGEFTRRFFLEENLGRASAPLENHSGNVFYYPLSLLVGFFPWSVFWWPALLNLLGQKSDSRKQAALCFLLCWVAVQVGIFTIAKTKLPSYVTPCYPALALLTAVYLDQFLSKTATISKHWMTIACAALTLTGVAILIGAGWAVPKYLPNQSILNWVGVPSAITGVFLLWSLLQQKHEALIPFMTSGALAFIVLLFGLAATSLDHEQQSHRLLRHLRGEPDNRLKLNMARPEVTAANLDLAERPKVGSYGCLEPTWVVYGGEPVFELALGIVSEKTSSRGNDFQSAKKLPWQAKSRPTVESFSAGSNVYILTLSDHLNELKSRLPKRYRVVDQVPLFLKDKDLILLHGR